jgi:hypothetical protein
MSTSSVLPPDAPAPRGPRAEQEAHPIFQAFLADREKPEHCWYCSRPLADLPWPAWFRSFYTQKLTPQGKQQFESYLETHDAEVRRQIISPLTGLALPRAHHLCDYLHEQCARYPTLEELEQQWSETAIDADLLDGKDEEDAR